MSTIPALRLRCPDCDRWIEFPVTAELADRDGNSVEVGVSVDPQPIADHATHHHWPEGGE